MLMITIINLLLSNAVTLRRDISILFNRTAILGLLYCISLGVRSLSITSEGIGLHGGLLQTTNITQIFQIFIFILSILILQLTSFYPREIFFREKDVKGEMELFSLGSNNIKGDLIKIMPCKDNEVLKKLEHYNTKIINKMGEHLKIIEYPLILLFVICGAVFLMSTNDLVSVFLSIELQSYGLYLLSTVYRNSELSTTGGLIYFLLGGLSSCFILLGTSLLYANSGTTSMDGLYIINSISEAVNNRLGDGGTQTLNEFARGINLGGSGEEWYKSYYLNFALLIFSIGFLFKVSAAPFHFWSPDVYDAIPTIVTTFVAIIAKISIFIFLLDLVYHTNNSLSSGEISWTYGLLISSLLSLIIGTVVGLTQFRIKKLLAYSTISHVGFILLALSICSIESTQAFIFYLVQYSVSNLNVFIILITIGFSLYNYRSENESKEDIIDSNNSPIQLVSQLKGYFYINPLLSLSLAITIFSFAGIPPLVGFFGKQMVLSAALDNGYIFLSLIAILTSVIGAVYYLNIIKEIFFYSPEIEKEVGEGGSFESTLKMKDMEIYRVSMTGPFSITISIITLVILLFIFINKEWLSMGTILVQVFFSN